MFFKFVPMLIALVLAIVIASRAKREKWVVFWLLFSGTIHVAMELSYGFFPEVVQHASTVSFFQFMMKPAGPVDFLNPRFWSGYYEQYARYDGRYVLHDPVILLITQAELVMAPACFILAWLIQRGSPWRHPVQVVLSTIQAYGAYVYFFEPVYRGTWSQLMTKDTVELLVGVIALNGLWILVPLFLIGQSSRAIANMAGRGSK